MPPLTPEQQAFAEEHHGLILDFKEPCAPEGYACQDLHYLRYGVRLLY